MIYYYAWNIDISNRKIWIWRGVSMVRIARNKDSRVLAEMAVQMWDSHTVDELEAEFVETLNDKQSAFFIKYINDLHKLMQRSLNNYVIKG